MKHIESYIPKKYSTDKYIKVEKNIYKTFQEVVEDDNSLALEGIMDDSLNEQLSKIDEWIPCTKEIEEGYLYCELNGKKTTEMKRKMKKFGFIKNKKKNQLGYMSLPLYLNQSQNSMKMSHLVNIFLNIH